MVRPCFAGSSLTINGINNALNTMSAAQSILGYGAGAVAETICLEAALVLQHAGTCHRLLRVSHGAPR